GPYAAGVAQSSVVVVDAEQQASYLPFGTRSRYETADDELLSPLALHLQPGVRTRAAVGRIELLGDHALQAYLASRLQDAGAVRVEGLAYAHPIAVKVYEQSF